MAALRQPHGKRVVHGLVWHSRQAELARQTPVEVVALYGKPRYTSARGSWQIFGPGAFSLYDGPGRLIVEEIAATLGAFIELDG